MARPDLVDLAWKIYAAGFYFMYSDATPEQSIFDEHRMDFAELKLRKHYFNDHALIKWVPRREFCGKPIGGFYSRRKLLEELLDGPKPDAAALADAMLEVGKILVYDWAFESSDRDPTKNLEYLCPISFLLDVKFPSRRPGIFGKFRGRRKVQKLHRFLADARLRAFEGWEAHAKTARDREKKKWDDFWEENQRRKRKRNAGSRQRSSEPTKSPYEILGLAANASADAVKAAWRRLAAQHHPDRFASNAYTDEQRHAAHILMVQINSARDALLA